ncbi:beta-galactosidase b [Diplodia corticola]|uniref:beta-galactosidase n=1 Tax=Diplodia corticola TaxID=236234 RepID=A0A1J9RKI8_9PEZI|nr:beta-galactosidase b [Diplodia corticola]OJD29039.1 beta-galactosidase b [Diplodia corticola]
MLRLRHLLALSSALLPLAATAQEWPVQDSGYTDAVQWDHYSFIVNGKRVYLFGGEMHPFRLPVPELWQDIVQKTKALGFNTFSFYTNWFFHNPHPNQTDFETAAHDISRLLEYAKDAGLFVAVRPGPYVNAELNAGGFPLWVTTGAYGELRDDNATYEAAWTPYQDGIAKVVAPYQIHKNGTVISYQLENEYGEQWLDSATKTPNQPAINYMEELNANARRNGIEVPTTHNSPNLQDFSWSKDQDTVGAGGNVNVLGLDNYPLCWSCDQSECTGVSNDYNLVEYYSWFQNNTPHQPSLMPEFQGGRYNPLDGDAGQCLEPMGPEFRNLFYRHNIDQKVTAQILYTLFGGTNWGWMAAPFIGTSYDYAAPIAEDRSLRDSWYETKSLALFTRVAEDLREADRVGNSTAYTTNDEVTATELRNKATGGAFYIARHADSVTGKPVSFKLHVDTSIGSLTIPQKAAEIELNAREAKIVPTDFRFSGQKLLYSTAEVFTYVELDGKPTVALWVPGGEGGEFLLEGAANMSAKAVPADAVSFHQSQHGLIVSFANQTGTTVVDTDKARFVILDRTDAWKTFAPVLTPDPHAPVNETILVQGPHLVRTAAISGDTLILTGDTSSDTTLDVFAPAAVKTVTWNGEPLSTTPTAHGSLSASLPGPLAVTLPPLSNLTWRSAPSLPEIAPNYTLSPAVWKPANATTTPSQYTSATTPYLYIDALGFHVGHHLYRATFAGSPALTGLFLALQGGTGFGWSAYLNGRFLHAEPGSSPAALEATNATIPFPANSSALLPGTDNVLVVLMDNSGHEQRAEALEVRGITNATLLSSSSSSAPAAFSSWHVAGTAASADATTTLLDPVRGPYNEGGLHGERAGWHLPGFDDSAWSIASPTSGSSSGAVLRAGGGSTTAESDVTFHRATVAALDIPRAHDGTVHFSLGVPEGGSEDVRALLFVNGYQFGRYRPGVSTATDFPVPPGVLDFSAGGENTLVVAVWAVGGREVGVEIGWRVEGVVRGGLGVGFESGGEGGYLRPGWGVERGVFA